METGSVGVAAMANLRAVRFGAHSLGEGLFVEKRS